jgi:hypothetical protein
MGCPTPPAACRAVRLNSERLNPERLNPERLNPERRGRA